eukprot:7654946-Pyramimonas_sp.AAC.1
MAVSGGGAKKGNSRKSMTGNLLVMLGAEKDDFYTTSAEQSCEAVVSPGDPVLSGGLFSTPLPPPL